MVWKNTTSKSIHKSENAFEFLKTAPHHVGKIGGNHL